MLKSLFIFLFIIGGASLNATATAPGIHYVTTTKLKVRASYSTNARHIYSIVYGNRVKVHEVRNGWARISYYKKDKTAKWVFAEFVSPRNKAKKTYKKKLIKKQKRISKEQTIDNLLAIAISGSDGFTKHANVFIPVSKKLFKNKVCKLSEFRKMKGWMELVEDEVYFTYCGGYSKKNKIYLNVKTGKVSK